MTLPKPYYHDERVGITIYHGDCREIIPHLPKVDLVLTDPPYGIGLDYSQYDDSQENLCKLVNEFFPMLKEKAETILLTPGHTNIWKYPPADWVFAWIYGTTNALNKFGFTSWQPILAYGKDPYLKNGLGARMDIIKDSHVAPRDGSHPCPKPIEFIKKMILRGSCKEGDAILDPFMGSGTTLRAAKDLGRKAIGIEIEEKYCEIAVKRLAQEVLF